MSTFEDIKGQDKSESDHDSGYREIISIVNSIAHGEHVEDIKKMLLTMETKEKEGQGITKFVLKIDPVCASSVLRMISERSTSEIKDNVGGRMVIYRDQQGDEKNDDCYYVDVHGQGINIDPKKSDRFYSETRNESSGTIHINTGLIKSDKKPSDIPAHALSVDEFLKHAVSAYGSTIGDDRQIDLDEDGVLTFTAGQPSNRFASAVFIRALLTGKNGGVPIIDYEDPNRTNDAMEYHDPVSIGEFKWDSIT